MWCGAAGPAWLLRCPGLLTRYRFCAVVGTALLPGAAVRQCCHLPARPRRRLPPQFCPPDPGSRFYVCSGPAPAPRAPSGSAGQARPSQSAVLRINNVQLKKHILLLVRRNIVFTPIVLIIIIISGMQVFILVPVHEYQPIF